MALFCCKVAEYLRPMELLNEEQRRAFDAVMAGRSVFITGPGGTGKSFLLQTIYANYKGRTGSQIAITALTGCAALLLGPWAKTLHSWSGIGLGRGSAEAAARSIALDSHKRKRWRTTTCLVIDEVSMLTPYLLEYLDTVGRHVRKCPGSPFGGLQLVFVGDFYQLPPVVKDVALVPGEAERTFAFESPLWNEIVKEVIILRTILRQADPVFQAILNEARVGALSPESYAALEARKTMEWKRREIKPSLLFTKNQDVNTINSTQLGKLTSEEKIFLAKSQVPPRMQKHVADFLIEKLDRDAPYEVELRLKERAQVMLLVNMDPAAGLVNGSRGIVTGFSPLDGMPMVKFLNGPPTAVRIEPAAWKTDGGSDDEVVVREQIPLRLAYALTIHKSQGASLDSALVDIGPSVFEYGQAYVAISRVRSLDSLYVFEIHPKAFKVHPAVKAFYEAVEKQERAGAGTEAGAGTAEAGTQDPAASTASALETLLRKFEYRTPKITKIGSKGDQ